jgi:hypothetical protein
MDLKNFFTPGTPDTGDPSIRTDAIQTNIPEDPASGVLTDISAVLVRNSKAAAAGAFLQTDVGKSLAAEAQSQVIQQKTAQYMPVIITVIVAAVILFLIARSR